MMRDCDHEASFVLRLNRCRLPLLDLAWAQHAHDPALIELGHHNIGLIVDGELGELPNADQPCRVKAPIKTGIRAAPLRNPRADSADCLGLYLGADSRGEQRRAVIAAHNRRYPTAGLRDTYQ